MLDGTVCWLTYMFVVSSVSTFHDGVIKWNHFTRYWPCVCVRGIQRSSMDSPHKDQWRGALMFLDMHLNKRFNKQLIYAWTNGWTNNILMIWDAVALIATSLRYIVHAIRKEMHHSTALFSYQNLLARKAVKQFLVCFIFSNDIRGSDIIWWLFSNTLPIYQSNNGYEFVMIKTGQEWYNSIVIQWLNLSQYDHWIKLNKQPLKPTALTKFVNKIYDNVLLSYISMMGWKRFNNLKILSTLRGFWHHHPSTLIYIFPGRLPIISGYLQENEDL